MSYFKIKKNLHSATCLAKGPCLNIKIKEGLMHKNPKKKPGHSFKNFQ